MRLPWLVRETEAFISYKGPWIPYSSTYGAHLLLCVYGFLKPITIPKQSLVASLVAKKSFAFIFNYRPWGSHASIYEAYLPLWMCGWWISITIANQRLGATLVTKKRKALWIWIFAPGAPTYGAYYHCECVDKYLSPYQSRAHWPSWLPRKSKACKFKFRRLEAITLTLFGLDYQKEEEEEETEKTKHHNQKIYAGLHPGIDNWSSTHQQ